nr:MAG TPA: hypothetical protein [Inoviridae sp.]
MATGRIFIMTIDIHIIVIIGILGAFWIMFHD